MFQFAQFSFHQIESAIGGAAILAWGGISAVQLVREKLHQPRCLVCKRAVMHQEQAHDIPAPIHRECYYLAKLIRDAT